VFREPNLSQGKIKLVPVSGEVASTEFELADITITVNLGTLKTIIIIIIIVIIIIIIIIIITL